MLADGKAAVWQELDITCAGPAALPRSVRASSVRQGVVGHPPTF
jgi:hypothetical protein